MSYFLHNLRRVFRELQAQPFSQLPARLQAMAGPKLTKLAEEAAVRTGAGGMIGRRYRGAGIALMFHEVHGDVDAELRTGCDADQLERIIGAVKASGRDIVSMEEGLRRLNDPGSRPFALLTFDDAYLDNRENALPVLERYQAPMTLFVPTGMIDRSLYAWWLGLRELIKSSDTVEITAMGASFQTGDLASKAAAMRQVTAWIGTDQAKADALASDFARFGVSVPGLIDHYAMTAEDLKAFASHPLVTIGAHTKSHRFLSGLSESDVRGEFSSNKMFLEDLLQTAVETLAYPYGTEKACGAREAEIAAQTGFQASFTTRPGQLFAEHLATPQLMPRIDFGYAPQSVAACASRLSGLHRAMITRFGDPVATLH
ncbi:polysaccharide deacetylase family protein [Roseibium sp.]|uniref:polysaccharide deacetylase family protein n=1 Tax=Roseibium sp. TaxID=1936156 RepID=UPI003A973376